MTRPPPPAAATCNLFCLRARVAGAGGGRVGSGVGAAAPQVVLVQRGPIRGGEPRAPCPCRRPAPSPPLPPALPRPGLRCRSPRCGGGSPRPLSTRGLPGGAGGEQGPWLDAGRGGRARPGDAGWVQAAACGAGRPEGGGMPPLPSPVWTRPFLGPAFPPSAAGPGVPAARGSHGPPAREWEGDGAPPPALRKSAASPSTPVAARRGATCGQGLALDRPFLVPRGERWLARRELRGRPSLALGPGPRRRRETPSSRAASLARPHRAGAVRGAWSRLLFAGCGGAARPEN